MIDFARITVKSGNGGRGASSFMHLKGKRYGKADGGDGGIGGNVYLVATRDLNTLEPFRYIKDYKAPDGESGFSNHRRGANGQDLMIKVPVGTVVKVRSQSQESKSGVEKTLYTNHFDFDLVREGEQILVARGGVGGRGNAKLRDEFGRRPRFAEGGEEGEAFQITLELKLIADVGLIGLPNAGKSTLLSVLTASKPAIAAYPFTTLEPNLGVMQVKVKSPAVTEVLAGRQSGKSRKSKGARDSLYTPDFDSRLVLADIPGLIEGASAGKGLGDLFLRHIERTKVLVHLIDIADLASQGEALQGWQRYQTVRNELKNYSKELMRKKEIIVLNKIDLVDSHMLKKIIAEFARHRKKMIAISAKEVEGLDRLVQELYKATQKR